MKTTRRTLFRMLAGLFAGFGAAKAAPVYEMLPLVVPRIWAVEHGVTVSSANYVKDWVVVSPGEITRIIRRGQPSEWRGWTRDPN